MIRFLQPEWLWLLALLPAVLLWRGRSGAVAAIEYSDVGIARKVARAARSRAGRWIWLLPIAAAALMIVGLARPQIGHGRTLVTANGIDIVLGLDVSARCRRSISSWLTGGSIASKWSSRWFPSSWTKGPTIASA
jgi:Ca-activated chloride channel family protein